MENGAKFDVVILDLTIPGGAGGAEVLKTLRELDPEVKAVVCSGYANDSVMANFKKYGFQSVLPKPFKLETLQQILMDNLADRIGK